jgi:hypothetical protein
MRQRAQGTGPNMTVRPSQAALASASHSADLPANAGFVLH